MKKLKQYIHRYYSDEDRYVGSNLKDLLKNLTIMFLLVATIYLCFRNYFLSKKLSSYEPKLNPTSVSVITKTNSSKTEQQTKIYTTEDNFKRVPKYSQVIMPDNILYWGTKDFKSGSKDNRFNFKLPDHSSSSTWSVNFDSIVNNLHSYDQGKLCQSEYYFRDFIPTDLGAFGPSKDSLVQILLDKNKVRFTSYNKAASVYQSKDYSIDLERYKYNWTSEGFTRSKTSQLYIQPYTSIKYGVCHKTFSITPGVSFKTRKLDYNLGISLNRDQRLNPNITTDIELEVVYKFGKWLK